MVRVFKGEKCTCMISDGEEGRVVVTEEGTRRSQILPKECPYRINNRGCIEVMVEEEQKPIETRK